MAIDFAERFATGASTRNQRRSGNQDDRPEAQFWLNIGYETEGNEDGNFTFVSLPTGIALDTQEPANVNVNNEDMADFRNSQNDLLSQLLAYAGDMEPGEERIIKLSVQLRRKKDKAAPKDINKSKFAKKLDFQNAE